MKSELQDKVTAGLTPKAVILRDDIIAWKGFPKDPFVYYARFIGERACSVNVKEPSPQAEVIEFLSELVEGDLDAVTPEKPIGLHGLRSLRTSPFQVGVVAHPSVANHTISKLVNFMTPVSYVVFPAFACEFTANDDVEDAKFRLKKTVNWADWVREPAPVVAMRFKRGSGVKSTGGKGLLLFRPEEADRTLKKVMEEGGFMEVENFKREVVMIKQDAGVFTVDVDAAGARVVSAELVTPWFNSFLREGVEGAKAKLHGA